MAIEKSHLEKKHTLKTREMQNEHLPTKDAVTIREQISALVSAIRKQWERITSTKKEVAEIRSRLGLGLDTSEIPSVQAEEEILETLEQKKVRLEKELAEVLTHDASAEYESLIENVKKSKIDWAHSSELARRLKIKGATDEDVGQVKDWLINNVNNAKTIVLPSDKFKDAASILAEMTNERNIQDGAAFHVSGARKDVPESVRDAVFVQEHPAKPSIPGQTEQPKKTVDENTLHHEFGHVAQNGLLESELYQDWNPAMKPTAPDKDYVGLIHETDTRIRSMFRDLGDTFDAHTEPFTQHTVDLLREKLRRGELNKDTKDLFEHYDDETIIKLANELPAI